MYKNLYMNKIGERAKIASLRLSNISIKKIEQMRKSIKEIVKFKDPIGKNLSVRKRPNGLTIKKVSIPIGVIGVIYESRPNVTSDVASLCFKSGNSVILRGGTEAFYSNLILSKLFRKSLKKNGVDENFVQFINIKNRKAVDFLLTGMNKFIDAVSYTHLTLPTKA